MNAIYLYVFWIIIGLAVELLHVYMMKRTFLNKDKSYRLRINIYAGTVAFVSALMSIVGFIILLIVYKYN